MRVLITGGGTGVGADLARGFAAASYDVVVAGRTRESLLAIPNATPVVADVTDEDSVAAMFAESGRCDVVIANAGAALSAPVKATSKADWDQMIGVNLTGVFLTLKAGLAQMDPAWGRLITVASVAGLKGYPYVAAYAAAKHGAVGFTRALAHEVARTGVTANALCPGFLDTEMTDRTLDNIVSTTGRSREQALAAITATNPQRRLIAPAEVTAAALWLCGEGSAAINGQAIAIDGGELG